MNDLEILGLDDLRRVAFKVCTALHRAGTTAVLTGGSAASVYAPETKQSEDADFIAFLVRDPNTFREALEALKFTDAGRVFKHPRVPITLDFPDEDIRIGGEPTDQYATLADGTLLLHILTPTDSVCDRLASFYYFRDRSALAAACGVAHAHPDGVDLDAVRLWSEREGELDRHREFVERLARY